MQHAQDGKPEEEMDKRIAKKIIAFIVLLSVVFSATACSAKMTNVELLSKAIEISKEWGENGRNLSRLGISAGELLLTESDIKEYLQSGSVKDLISFLFWNKSEHNAQALYDLIHNVCESDFIDMVSIKNGFYAQHPEAQPQTTTTTQSGKFNNAEDGNSIYSSSRSTEHYAYYFGDFAIEYVDGYRYDSGRYEWSNGKFYDEPASWKSYTEHNLFYKGKEISSRIISYQTFAEISLGKYEQMETQELEKISFESVFGFNAIDMGDYLYIISKDSGFNMDIINIKNNSKKDG